MSGEQRISLAFEMSELARELAKEGIRREHPDWPETSDTRAVALGILSGAATYCSAMSATEVLQRIVAALDRSEIQYMLTRPFASAHHGAPRATLDIDTVVAANPDKLRTLARLLPDTQYCMDIDAAIEADRRQSPFNVIDLASGWKIDLIIRSPRLLVRRSSVDDNSLACKECLCMLRP